MRDYARIAPQLWTGHTGRKIRAAGPEAQVLAFYLLTCPSASWIGLYYLALPTLQHETGLSADATRRAFAALREIGFAFYDDDSEQVWVPEMARFQIGDELKPNDKKILGIKKDLESLTGSPFVGAFIERYGEVFHIRLAKALTSPSQGPCGDTVRGISPNRTDTEAEPKGSPSTSEPQNSNSEPTYQPGAVMLGGVAIELDDCKWAQPFADEWRRLRGEPRFDRIVTAIAPLRRMHQDAELLGRWSRYLESAVTPKDVQCSTPAKFAEIHEQFAPRKPERPSNIPSADETRARMLAEREEFKRRRAEEEAAMAATKVGAA